jgi:hypothetical protein
VGIAAAALARRAIEACGARRGGRRDGRRAPEPTASRMTPRSFAQRAAAGGAGRYVVVFGDSLLTASPRALDANDLRRIRTEDRPLVLGRGATRLVSVPIKDSDDWDIVGSGAVADSSVSELPRHALLLAAFGNRGGLGLDISVTRHSATRRVALASRFSGRAVLESRALEGTASSRPQRAVASAAPAPATGSPALVGRRSSTNAQRVGFPPRSISPVVVHTRTARFTLYLSLHGGTFSLR